MNQELSTAKFDAERAAEYAVQSRIALAGYDACQELTACLLAATLDPAAAARVLVVGVGGNASEIRALAPLAPNWRYVGVDPSPDMLNAARDVLKSEGLLDRTSLHQGYLEDLPDQEPFDAAIMFGVLHHLRGDVAKRSILEALVSRMREGAPVVVAGNRYEYSSKPLLLNAWKQRWLFAGEAPERIDHMLARITLAADPPHSNEDFEAYLERAGVEELQQFFCSLFFAAWIGRTREKRTRSASSR